MAIALIEQHNTAQGFAAELHCDDTSDVAKLPEFARKYKLSLGSTCLCVSNSNVYAMKSDGTWKAL